MPKNKFMPQEGKTNVETPVQNEVENTRFVIQEILKIEGGKYIMIDDNKKCFDYDEKIKFERVEKILMDQH